jgi:hypothetical protein
MSGSWTSFVRIQTLPSATTPFSLSTVSSRSVRSERRRKRCFGLLARLIGQNRSPLPPAMMQAWNLGSGFIG